MRIYLATVLLCAAWACGPDPSTPVTAAEPPVFVGAARDRTARLTTNEFGDEVVLTTLAVDVERTVRGPQQPVRVTVEMQGGTVMRDGVSLTLEVSGQEIPAPGERALFVMTGAGNRVQEAFSLERFPDKEALK